MDGEFRSSLVCLKSLTHVPLTPRGRRLSSDWTCWKSSDLNKVVGGVLFLSWWRCRLWHLFYKVPVTTVPDSFLPHTLREVVGVRDYHESHVVDPFPDRRFSSFFGVTWDTDMDMRHGWECVLVLKTPKLLPGFLCEDPNYDYVWSQTSTSSRRRGNINFYKGSGLQWIVVNYTLLVCNRLNVTFYSMCRDGPFNKHGIFNLGLEISIDSHTVVRCPVDQVKGVYGYRI